MSAAERAHAMAEQGAAAYRAEQPPALALPDGWVWHNKSGFAQYDMFETRERVTIYADSEGILTAGRMRREHSPDDARALAACLVEAAGIVEQLRAGAR